MKLYNYSLLIVLLVVLSCKKPFSKKQETALALPIETSKNNESVVFIAGYDDGSNTYYTNAKKHFKNQGFLVIDYLYSIDAIIKWLNLNSSPNKNFNEIHIVSHSNPWLGMSLKTYETGKRIQLKNLQKDKQAGKMASLKSGITNQSKIIFHACGLSENKALLKEIKAIFSTTTVTPKVYASPFFNIFGGKYTSHYLAKPYYGFYPTAESPGPAQLSKEFKATYPNTAIDWFTTLKTRHETQIGSVYSYKFNIPIEWEFIFDNSNNIPEFKTKDAIMDWIAESTEMAKTLYALNIPIEKYRWRTKVQANKLIVKGKTTVLCVLEPIMNSKDHYEYRKTAIKDTVLYEAF